MVKLAHFVLRSVSHLHSVYFFLLGEMVVPCDKNDAKCIKIAQKQLQKAVEKIPALAVQKLDPLQLDTIEGDLINFSYKFKKSTATGFKNTHIHDVSFDLDKLILSYGITCRDVTIKGNYSFSGRLLLLPFESEGDYNIHAKKYDVSFRGRLRKAYDDYGKAYLMIKSHNYNSEAAEGITYEFSNLINGDQDVSDVVLQFANDNWKEVADYVQAPVLEACLKEMIVNLNKLIKTIPIEAYYLKDPESAETQHSN